MSGRSYAWRALIPMTETELATCLLKPWVYATKVHAFDVTGEPVADVATRDDPVRVTLCRRRAPGVEDGLGWYCEDDCELRGRGRCRTCEAVLRRLGGEAA